jgi:hypothetical protein
MVFRFPLGSLGSSCPGLYHEPFPPSRMNLVLSKSATRSGHHRLVLYANGEGSPITLDSLHLDRLLATGLFIELEDP